MPKNIRVYELARELGLTNKETLDVCDELGIGVKSHSSSVVEAQADRVRRKAEREGLIRDEQPSEPDPPAKKKAAKKKAAAAKPAPPKPAPPEEAPSEESSPPAQAEPEPVAPDAETTKPPPAPDIAPPSLPPPGRPPAREVVAPAAKAPDVDEQPPSEPVVEPDAQPAAEVEPEPAAEPEVDSEPAAASPAPPSAPPSDLPPPPRRLVTSSGQESPRVRAPEPPAARPQAEVPAARSAPRPEPAAAPAARAPQAPDIGSPPPPPGRPPSGPRSSAGKVIPPPPVPPRSSSGKPIPPPPGPPKASRPGPTGARPSRPGGGGMRPGGGPGGAPGGAPGGPGGAPGGPGGRPGGGRPGGRPGGPQQRRGRKGKRRRRQREELQPQQLPTYTPLDAPVPEGEIVIDRGSTAQEMASKLNRSAADVVRFLLQQGEMVTATMSLSDDMIDLFAAEIGAVVRIIDPGAEQEEEMLRVLDVSLEEVEDTTERPPIVTVMGHVDHGKTLLLDRIRSANVVEGEAGGITQHIGAYQTDRNGKLLTFIDTPGHEAFTAMRARGAEATDIVVLVVAADDGVMPQTLEAIDHARAAEVPIIVAINKMDREGADPNRVLAQLAERNLIPESYGGDVITVEVSAMTEMGIDDLLDQILVVSEIEELTANAQGRAQGTVLESNLDKGRGPVATILVQKGTLEVGDPLVAGAAWGRVRAMIDDHGRQVKSAGPSTPVQVLGLNEVARAGDMFVVAPDEKTANRVAETREHWQRQASMANSAAASSGGATLEDLFKQIQAGEAVTLNLILKADVHGSLEAVTDSLRKLERPDVKLAFVSRGVGGINENDVGLAVASNATIIGFNVRPDRKAREAAEAEGVELRLYEIIYKLIEDVQNAMLGMLEPKFEEIVTGEAQVRQVFRIKGVGPVAGCFVEHGTIAQGSKVRFLREGTIIWKGSINSLKHFQDDTKEVRAGMECGIGLTDFTDLKESDVIETYDEKEIPIS